MKKWVTRKLNKDNAVAISQRYDLPMLIAMLLDIRGITEEEMLHFPKGSFLVRIAKKMHLM